MHTAGTLALQGSGFCYAVSLCIINPDVCECVKNAIILDKLCNRFNAHQCCQLVDRPHQSMVYLVCFYSPDETAVYLEVINWQILQV